MKVSLIGQDKVIDSVTNAIQRASVGLKDPIKPIGSFLFAGSTGCGKTLTGKILANELIKDRDNLITIDCSEYSADHEYSKLIGCFVPGTKVLNFDGTVTNIEDVKIGDEVVSHTGNKRKVEHVHEYFKDGSMIKFTTNLSNIPITTTKTHEIYTIKGQPCAYKNRKHVTCKPTCSKKDCSFKLYEKYEPVWLPAETLEKGDIVMYPVVKTAGDFPIRIDLAEYCKDFKRYKFNDTHVWAQKHVKVPRFINVGTDFARLAGYFVSEGGVAESKKTFNFTFNIKEYSYIIEVVKLVRKLFGNDLRIRIVDRTLENNTFRIFVSSSVVGNMLSHLFGENTHVKKLPKWFNELPDDVLKGFLQTAVFGDGCTVVPRRMDYSTVSPNLFYQMEQIFRKIGYVTYKSLEKVGSSKLRRTDRYRLYISGDQINKLNDDLILDIDMKGMENTHIQRWSWRDEDYQYIQVKSVEEVTYTGKVYDLSVETDTSYVTEIAVHNSPNGYQGYENGGLLTNAVMENPFSVVVFDEIEKASSKIYQLLLQVLDEGRLTDNKGNKVSFKDTVIILTSNIGVENIDNISKTIGFGDVSVVTEDKKEKAIGKALKQKFKPEFLNRIDEVIYFNDLTKEDYLRIIDVELFKLNSNLQSNKTKYKDVELFFDKKICEFIYEKGITKEYGARPLKRAIEKHISTPLAVQLLKGITDTDTVIAISTANKEVVFKFSKKPSKIPAYLEAGPVKELLEAGGIANV
jgi:intein/homing endonuclease